MRALLLDADNQLVRAPFLLFISTILLLAGGLYGELYGRPYHKVLPQVTWDLPLAAAGNFDAITGARRALGCV